MTHQQQSAVDPQQQQQYAQYYAQQQQYYAQAWQQQGAQGWGQQSGEQQGAQGWGQHQGGYDQGGWGQQQGGYGHGGWGQQGGGGDWGGHHGGGYGGGHGGSHHHQNHHQRPIAPPSTTIWVGNLHPETQEVELHQAFTPFGEILSIKLLQHKNCAFVRYKDMEGSTAAYNNMRNCTIHGQMVKVNWGKAQAPRPDDDRDRQRPGDPPPCRNLWLGNIPPDTSEDEIRGAFVQFGEITRIKVLPHKNCAFVNFRDLEKALIARRQMNGNFTLRGNVIKVNFGRETQKDKNDYGSLGLEGLPPPDHEDLASIGIHIDDRPPEPENQERKTVIDKLATFVVKSGPAFEENVKTKQGNNPKFSFLFEGQDDYEYYKWKIYDLRKNQEESGAVAVAPQEGPYSAPARLAPDETKELSRLLLTLVATNESIKRGTDYIMERKTKAREISNFMKMRATANVSFDTKLNLLYLLNDVLQHSRDARKEGEESDVFAFNFSTHIENIMVNAYSVHTNQEEANKLFTLLDIWGQRKIFKEDLLAVIKKKMEETAPPAPPELPPPGVGLHEPPAGYHNVPPPPPSQQQTSQSRAVDDFLARHSRPSNRGSDRGYDDRGSDRGYDDRGRDRDYDRRDDRKRRSSRSPRRDRDRDKRSRGWDSKGSRYD